MRHNSRMVRIGEVLADVVAAQFGQDWQTLRRHRELDGL